MPVPRPSPEFSAGEEIANALTHGIGLVGAILSTWWMVDEALLRGDFGHVAAVAVFGLTLVNLYAASTFCHALPSGPRKRAFELLDYTGIYALIAGTYTPFLIGPLRGPVGWIFFSIVWALALLGMLVELSKSPRRLGTSMGLYLGMGWMGLTVAPALAQQLPPEGLMLLLWGGLAYTFGVIFYLWRGFYFHHAIWHVFVLAGSTLHVQAAVLYAIP
jgi:hemolysin III